MKIKKIGIKDNIPWTAREPPLFSPDILSMKIK